MSVLFHEGADYVGCDVVVNYHLVVLPVDVNAEFLLAT